jgi:hypothetical protein
LGYELLIFVDAMEAGAPIAGQICTALLSLSIDNRFQPGCPFNNVTHEPHSCAGKKKQRFETNPKRPEQKKKGVWFPPITDPLGIVWSCQVLVVRGGEPQGAGSEIPITRFPGMAQEQHMAAFWFLSVLLPAEEEKSTPKHADRGPPS